MKVPKFIKILYTKPLSEYERKWLYAIKTGKPVGYDLDVYPPMTLKEYKKMCERDELYR